MTAALTANRRLAIALGWTNITEAGGALLGMPPWAAPNSRGQAAVPNWAGDWRACGPLGSEHQVDIFHNWGSVHGRWSKSEYARASVTDHPDGSDDRDAANRMAIVQAVAAKLEAGQ